LIGRRALLVVVALLLAALACCATATFLFGDNVRRLFEPSTDVFPGPDAGVDDGGDY
jgi:hypothetical protein